METWQAGNIQEDAGESSTQRGRKPDETEAREVGRVDV